MVRIIIYIIFLFNFNSLLANELNLEEKMYFSFFDINKDNQISLEEINESMKLIFQLIDSNGDGNLSNDEILELKNIIESIS